MTTFTTFCALVFTSVNITVMSVHSVMKSISHTEYMDTLSSVSVHVSSHVCFLFSVFVTLYFVSRYQ